MFRKTENTPPHCLQRGGAWRGGTNVLTYPTLAEMACSSLANATISRSFILAASFYAKNCIYCLSKLNGTLSKRALMSRLSSTFIEPPIKVKRSEMVYIESYKGQQWLFPPAIEDLIPKDHVCYIVESFVESLDFSKFDIKYAGAGHPAYHPRIILKILTMGFIDKIRSSRRLARNSRENVIYIYLSEKLSPDFRTVSDFRKNNG